MAAPASAPIADGESAERGDPMSGPSRPVDRDDRLTIPAPAIVEASAIDELVERAVRELNAICRDSTLQFAFAIGEFLVQRFYSGNLDAWRSRDPTKSDSLRKLARHPDLAMSPGTLYRSVAMYELAQRLELRNYQRVSTTHFRLVLPLVPREQARLLRATEEAGWSVCRLEEEIAALVQQDPSVRSTRGGRKRASSLSKALRALRQCSHALATFLTDDSGDLASVDLAQTTLDALRTLRDACARVDRRLAQHLPGARTLPPPPNLVEGSSSESPHGPERHRKR